MIITGPNDSVQRLPCGPIENHEHQTLEAFRRFKLKYRLKSAMYCDACNESAEFRITPTSFVWKCQCRALHFPPV